MRGVFSAKGPDSSFGGVPVVYIAPKTPTLEEEVQLRVQVEEEDRRNTRKGTKWESKNGQPHDVDDNVDDMKRAPTHS